MNDDVSVTTDILERLRTTAAVRQVTPKDACAAAAEIERLRATVEALHVAHHQAMWEDTLMPIADALGIGIHDDYGVPRRQFQMVEAIVEEIRRG